MDAWPEVVLWLLFAAGALSRGPFILYMYSISIIFGGLSMIPPEVSGLNIPPATTCAIILLAKILLRSDNLMLSLRQAVDVRKLGLLGFFAVYVVFTAMIYPRLFQGDVMLYSLNAAESETPLAPTSSNLAQTIYLLTAIITTFAFSAAVRSEQFRRHYMRGVLITAFALVLSGVIDLSLAEVDASDLLSALHNATYHDLSTVQVAGLHRVVGFMPEASSYGGICCTYLGFLAFNIGAFEPAHRRRIVPILIIGLGAMTLLSTSSTGYLGFGVLIAVYLSRVFYGLVLIPIRSASRLRQAVYVLSALVVIATFLAIIGPLVYQHLKPLLDAVLFQKTSSSSYLERNRWTHAGLLAFFATHGVGVGVGSVRTSNWFVNILASTGIIGVALFFGFVARVLWPSASLRTAADRKFANGVRLALLPSSAMIFVSGTTPDPGIGTMSWLGLVYGLRLRPQPSTVIPGPIEPNPKLGAGVLNT